MPDRGGADAMSNAIDAQRLVRSASAALAHNDPQSALQSLVQAAKRTPKDVRLHISIGVVLQMLQRPTDAEYAFNNALKIDPNEPTALCALATLKSERKEAAESEQLARRAALADPANVQARLLLARALADQGKSDEAGEELEKAVLENPAAAEPRTALGGRLQELGRFAEAREQFLRAIQVDPRSGQAYWGLVRTASIAEKDRDLLAQIEATRSDPGVDAASRMEMLFSLGKAYDDLGEFEHAMERFSEANQIRDLSLNQYRAFPRAAYERTFTGLPNVFRKSIVAPPSAQPDEPTPIFIVGMPRSGTTLIEQILTSHSLVAAGGEIDFWQSEAMKCIDFDSSRFDLGLARAAKKTYNARLKQLAEGSPFVTDKMPDNYRVLGALATIYPQARFIHARRHPVATCLSIFFTPFRFPPDYCADLEKLAFVYSHYRQLMDHWKQVVPAESVFDLPYEELIEDPETTTRRLVAHCGLQWEVACLRPEDQPRIVRTASAWQVRQPVYRTSLGRWRNYEPWIGPLSELIR